MPIGVGGNVHYAGDYISSMEYVPELRGFRRSIEVFTKMRNDSQVEAVLNLIKMPILGSIWEIECENKQIKNFVEDQLKMGTEFLDLLEQLLTFVEFGFSAFEITKKYNKSGRLVELDDVGFRAQSSISNWFKDGSIEQYVPGSINTVKIPNERLMLTSFRREGDAYWGRSILRSAYKNWWYREELLRLVAISARRFAVGVPIAEPNWEDLQPGEIRAHPTPAEKESAKNILKRLASGEDSWILSDGVYKYSFLSLQENQRLDLEPPVIYHDNQISKMSFSSFIQFGTSGGGNRSLLASFLDLFYDALHFVAKIPQRKIQRTIIEPLVMDNFGPEESRKCKLIFSGLRAKSIDTLSVALDRLREHIRPNERLEDTLLGVMDLPKFQEPALPRLDTTAQPVNPEGPDPRINRGED